jgi:hypothetical protein
LVFADELDINGIIPGAVSAADPAAVRQGMAILAAPRPAILTLKYSYNKGI